MDDRKNNTGHKEQQGHGNIGDIYRGQTNIYGRGIVNNGMILI